MNIQETLIINRSDSQCANCGKDASATDVKHEPGCGIVFKQVSTAYIGMENIVTAMRQDLKYINYPVVMARRGHWLS